MAKCVKDKMKHEVLRLSNNEAAELVKKSPSRYEYTDKTTWRQYLNKEGVYCVD